MPVSTLVAPPWNRVVGTSGSVRAEIVIPLGCAPDRLGGPAVLALSLWAPVALVMLLAAVANTSFPRAQQSPVLVVARVAGG
jgi:hypothetical protein